MPRFLAFLLGFFIAAGGAVAGEAWAAGGRYLVYGGTAEQQGQVRFALEVSTFDWGIVGKPVVIHITPGGGVFATRGHIWIPASVVDGSPKSWLEIQGEYAHQVDFFVLSDPVRRKFQALLGGSAWWYTSSLRPPEEYTSERFASLLAWAYWPGPQKSLPMRWKSGDSLAVLAARFRALMQKLVGVPDPAGGATLAGR